MNPIQFQVNVSLDSDAIIDFLVRAIEKGTTSALEKMLPVAQQRNHEAPTQDSNHVSAQGSSQNQSDKSQLDAKLVAANAIAKMLGVSARMVWRLRDSGGIPKPVIIGRLVRWRSEAIEEWIQAGCPAVERRGVKRRNAR